MIKTYVFDLDGTLCYTPILNGKPDYINAVPNHQRIAVVVELIKCGHKIIIDTARGSETGTDWWQITSHQLIKWGIAYDKLRVGVKFVADFYIDDKGVEDTNFFENDYHILC
jgi:hypothetical protein